MATVTTMEIKLDKATPATMFDKLCWVSSLIGLATIAADPPRIRTT